LRKGRILLSVRVHGNFNYIIGTRPIELFFIQSH
jgi:hypothetical protein